MITTLPTMRRINTNRDIMWSEKGPANERTSIPRKESGTQNFITGNFISAIFNPLSSTQDYFLFSTL